MEPIAVNPPAPPPTPSVASGQTQTSRGRDDSSFSPALTQAVAEQNKSTNAGSTPTAASSKNASPGSPPSSDKTDSKKSTQTAERKSTQDTAAPKKTDTPVGKKSGNKQSNSQSSKDGSNQGTAQQEQGNDPSQSTPAGASVLTAGLSGDPSLFDPQQAGAALSGVSSSGKQPLPETPPDLSTPSKGNTDDNQLQDLSRILQDTVKPGQPVNGSPAATGGATPAASSSDAGQNTLAGQQLQDMLTAGGATVVSASQTQANSLDSLTSPVFTIDQVQNQNAIALPAVANIGSLLFSNSNHGLDKNTESTDTDSTDMDSSLSKLMSDLQFLSGKADPISLKDTAKIAGKDTAFPEAGNTQTTLLNALSATDTPGANLQLGQLTFTGSLLQSVQTNQLTSQQPSAGTGGTSGSGQTSWTPTQENALVTQVMQNFSLNSSLPTSKMVVKLYPEELGELKIDVQMKAGAIKANIVTQNEQVQQVLEKYIPKLKSLMEQQGLTVDDIQVTNTSDHSSGHNLFQEDFADSNDFSSQGKSAKSTPFFNLSFEKALSETPATRLGVNVTI